MNDTETLPFPSVAGLVPLSCQASEHKHIFTYALSHGDSKLEVGIMKLSPTIMVDSPPCVAYVRYPNAQVPLWKYADEKARFEKYHRQSWQHVVGFYHPDGEQPLLAIFEWTIESGFGSLCYVITIEEVVAADDRLAVSESARLKRLLGRITERPVCYSDEERRALRGLEARERAKPILARPTVTVTVPDGREFVGTPATADEWPLLPQGTPVVLVAAYDGKSPTAISGALAVLRVQPTVTGARAYSYIELSPAQPLAPAVAAAELPSAPTDATLLTGYEVRFRSGPVVNARRFATIADLRAARQLGEFDNGGLAVIYDEGVPTLYQVTRSGVTTVSEKTYELHPYL